MIDKKFGYVTEIATGNIVSYFDLPAVPEDTDIYTYTECEESEKPELYEKPYYNATTFKRACVADSDLSTVMMLAPAALIDAINAANFEVVKAGIDFMLAQSIATQDQYDKFVALLIDHGGDDISQL